MRTLVGATGGTEVDVVELHRLTGGNAFFVTEAISAETDGLPPTVRDAVLARVLRLTDVERQGLDVVALCGARAETQVLERVLTDGLRTLDGPLARGLLRRVGTDIVFRHELARLAVVGEIPTGRAVHIHRRLLAVLRDQDTDPARVAHHAEAAGDAAAVLAAAPAAGARAAEMGAHQEAARQYQRALGCADRLAPADRAELLWSLGYELYLTGHIDGAIDVMTRARTIWEAAGETVRVGDAWRCQSRLHWFAGRHDAALDDAERAVALLDGSESVEQALALSHRAGLEMLGSNLAGTRRWSAPALELLDRLPDDSRREAVRVHALNNLGTMEIVAGDLADGERMLTESLTDARAHDLHEHAARAYCNLASSAVVQRRFAEASRYFAEGLEYCTERDLDSWERYLVGWRARMHLDRGELRRCPRGRRVRPRPARHGRRRQPRATHRPRPPRRAGRERRRRPPAGRGDADREGDARTAASRADHQRRVRGGVAGRRRVCP